MKVSPQYLVEHYDDVASAVHGGEVVEVELREKPALRLVPSPVQNRTDKRVLGAGRGELRMLSDDEWERMDEKWRKSFEDKFDSDVA